MEGKGGRGPSLNRPKLARAADDEALKKVIEDGIAPEMPEFWFLSKEALAQVASYVRELGRLPEESVPGDAAHGAQLYANSGCGGCHIVGGQGNGFGPDLSDIGAKRSAAHLKDSLLKPASALPERFLLVEATTPAGQKIRGVRANEDSFTIQIQDMAGRFHSFRKSELGSFRKLRGETPMPSYEARLTEAEVQDLVAWLATLKGAK